MGADNYVKRVTQDGEVYVENYINFMKPSPYAGGKIEIRIKRGSKCSRLLTNK